MNKTTSTAPNPELAEQLLTQLTTYVEADSTVKGKESKNDIDGINLWKSVKK